MIGLRDCPSVYSIYRSEMSLYFFMRAIKVFS